MEVERFPGQFNTSSSTVTVTDNENTNEGNELIFAADADLDGGTISLESDGDAHITLQRVRFQQPTLVVTLQVLYKQQHNPM